MFQLQLAANPELGAVIPGTGGLRKVRVAASGRGKRGGARVIYYWVPRRDLILLLFVYPKNEAPDLTAEQRKKLRRIVEEEFSDENRTI